MDTNWPKRSDSAIAPQALALMNHPFVLECAGAFAQRVLDDAADDNARIARAFLLAYGRPPQAGEQALFAGALAQMKPGQELETWRRLCHALLASSEFFYLD